MTNRKRGREGKQRGLANKNKGGACQNENGPIAIRKRRGKQAHPIKIGSWRVWEVLTNEKIKRQ